MVFGAKRDSKFAEKAPVETQKGSAEIFRST